MKKTNHWYIIIMSITARDPDYTTKLRWQKILFAFYSWNGKRTFTLANGSPLNLKLLVRVSKDTNKVPK